MPESVQDYPFSIMDVTTLLGIRLRREHSRGWYADCPFCGDTRGRLDISTAENVWHCHRCGEGGGMLSLYGKIQGLSNRSAYEEICERLCEEAVPKITPAIHRRGSEEQPKQADLMQLHQTYSQLLGLLTLADRHKIHLRSPKRGLTEQQIEQLGFRSTPDRALCRELTARLLALGCTVEGVPGFYRSEDGGWTMNFSRRTSGILIPAVGLDGLIRGMQILLDTPLKQKDDPPEKKGAKYIWFSSAAKAGGISSGSPVHFLGDPFAKTVYITEGLLKGDIVYSLTGCACIAVAGVNNLSRLEPVLAQLKRNGTEQIIEAYDMDKFSNPAVMRGAEKIYALAKKHKMKCSRLTWNSRYKGLDDWLLSLQDKSSGQGSTLPAPYRRK